MEARVYITNFCDIVEFTAIFPECTEILIWEVYIQNLKPKLVTAVTFYALVLSWCRMPNSSSMRMYAITKYALQIIKII
jgi:hypothetical protein